MSLNQDLSKEPISTHRQHLSNLRKRFEEYKVKDEIVTRMEEEAAQKLLDKQKLEKEREAIRLETEKQALILELQRVSNAKPPAPPPPPQPVQQPPAPSFFNTGAMSFGYPGMVTEKEAIDWLRNGF